MATHSDTQYAKSGDLNIAYREFGSGPRDILFIPGFVSNVDLMSEVPWIAHDVGRLASLGRVVYFDKRGTGVSDRTLGSGTIEDRMDDLRAVADAAGIAPGAVVGLSEGGPLALLFAAAYPERVTHLVLWGTMARMLVAPDYPAGISQETRAAFVDAVTARWGTGRALPLLIDMPDDAATVRSTARYERQAASPNDVRSILNHNIEVDVRSVLGLIRVPTLVVHRVGDPLVAVAHARYLAERIDGARVVELPGDWHVSAYVGRDDDVFDAIAQFVAGDPAVAAGPTERVLATVLLTDIVDSTVHAVAMGDRQWKAVLEQHDAVVRRAVEDHRGVVVKQTGDGVLGTFDGPGRAVRAAQAVRDGVALLGLQVRVGVHAGEIERRGDDVAGIAVHIAARLAAGADPGEVRVSSTVKDLVVGSGLEFEERGTVELKGVPGEWRVFAAMG